MCCTRLAEIQDTKNRQKFTTSAPSHNFVRLYRRNRKNLLNSNISYTCPHNMVNFGSLAVEICCRVWGTPANFNGFRVLAALLHGTRVVGVSQSLQHWTQGATYIWKGGHHVWHWPTFYFTILYFALLNCAATFNKMQPNLAQSTAVERCLSYANIILVDFINDYFRKLSVR